MKEKIGGLFFLIGLLFVFGGVGYSEISESWTEFWIGIAEAGLGIIFLLLFLLQGRDFKKYPKTKKHPWPK